MGKKVISLNDVKNYLADGKKEIVIDKNTILTPSAKDLVSTGAISIVEVEKNTYSCAGRCTVSNTQIKELVKSVAKEKNINICENDIEKVTELIVRQI